MALKYGGSLRRSGQRNGRRPEKSRRGLPVASPTSTSAIPPASVPGHHSGPNLTAYGHKKLGVLLSWETWPARFVGTPIVAQSCCFGNVVKDGYLADELFYSLSGITSGSGGNVSGGPGMGQQLTVVWPTVKEVRQSLEGWYAGRHLGAGERETEGRREGG